MISGGPRQAEAEGGGAERDHGDHEPTESHAPACVDIGDRPVDQRHCKSEADEIEVVGQPAQWTEQIGAARDRADRSVQQSNGSEAQRDQPWACPARQRRA